MANLEKGVTVRSGRCHACGHPVPFVTMKNGNLWYGCTHPDESGQTCGTRHYFGRAESQKFIREYLEHRKAANQSRRAAERPATEEKEIKTDGPEQTGRAERPAAVNTNAAPLSYEEQFG